MDIQNAKYWFIQTAMSFQNTLYRWGGDGPSGLDCSGLVVECLKSIGIMAGDSDATANHIFLQHAADEVDAPTEGCLAFWFSGSRATHVAICLDEDVCLTADGGGKEIHTREDAIRRKAFVKVRPIFHRQTPPRFVNLFQE